MIPIKKSPNADSRSAKGSVDIDALEQSTIDHIRDVQLALEYFCGLLYTAGSRHDFTKRAYLEEFHHDFQTLKPGDEFKNGKWYNLHCYRERHHLLSRAPEDVNLIDVFEYISDCVMAGMARTGEVYDISLPSELMQKALTNTVDLLKSQVVIMEDVCYAINQKRYMCGRCNGTFDEPVWRSGCGGSVDGECPHCGSWSYTSV